MLEVNDCTKCSSVDKLSSKSPTLKGATTGFTSKVCPVAVMPYNERLQCDQLGARGLRNVLGSALLCWHCLGRGAPTSFIQGPPGAQDTHASRETGARREQGQCHGEMLDLLHASQPTQHPTQHILPGLPGCGRPAAYAPSIHLAVTGLRWISSRVAGWIDIPRSLGTTAEVTNAGSRMPPRAGCPKVSCYGCE